MRVDQFVPSLAPHDAIGGHVLNARQALRQAGFESDIWVGEIARPLRHEARDYHEYPTAAPADVIMYHASIHSRMASFVGERPERLVVDYHNITPSRFFAGWDPVSEARMDLGRVELRDLAGRAELGIADSPYNQAELVEAGYRTTAVCPILADYPQGGAADADALHRLEPERSQSGTRWLFVGRLAPNKCQHDVIGAFAIYRRLFDPQATLTLVGGSTAPRYEQALRALATELEVDEAVRFAGTIPLGQLVAQYRSADVMVCLSEHEGFCVPVVEAMAIGVPVVAFAAAAVPDTVGDAAVLLDDKDPLVVACAVDGIVSDGALRDELIGAGRVRAEELSLPRTAKQLVAQLSQLIERPGPS